ncbi:MAG: MBL fold metallo-hydrolase [Treponema sp.]|nr:MBL fold metallo-hydrolase [Treponema sp.]
MRLYCHYCRPVFSNCYIAGTDFPEEETALPEAADQGTAHRKAIIIDPGEMDSTILNLIEDNDYTLAGVFITHDHPPNVKGLATIMRIYDTEVYATAPAIKGHRTTLVRDGDIVSIGPFRIEVILIPGHSADSAVFKINRLLFTGDTLGAGLIGNTVSSYAAAAQVNALRSKIFSLPGDYTVLPAQGPPTSLKVERQFNFGIDSFEKQKKRRPVFRVEL